LLFVEKKHPSKQLKLVPKAGLWPSNRIYLPVLACQTFGPQRLTMDHLDFLCQFVIHSVNVSNINTKITNPRPFAKVSRDRDQLQLKNMYFY